jgi:hypothetical protein
MLMAPVAAPSIVAMIVSRVRMVLCAVRRRAYRGDTSLRQGEFSGTANGPGRSGRQPQRPRFPGVALVEVLRPWGLSTLLCRCWWREAGIEQK